MSQGHAVCSSVFFFFFYRNSSTLPNRSTVQSALLRSLRSFVAFIIHYFYMFVQTERCLEGEKLLEPNSCSNTKSFLVYLAAS